MELKVETAPARRPTRQKRQGGGRQKERRGGGPRRLTMCISETDEPLENGRTTTASPGAAPSHGEARSWTHRRPPGDGRKRNQNTLLRFSGRKTQRRTPSNERYLTLVTLRVCYVAGATTEECPNRPRC